jgi:hypothetical protein
MGNRRQRDRTSCRAAAVPVVRWMAPIMRDCRSSRNRTLRRPDTTPAEPARRGVPSRTATLSECLAYARVDPERLTARDPTGHHTDIIHEPLADLTRRHSADQGGDDTDSTRRPAPADRLQEARALGARSRSIAGSSESVSSGRHAMTRPGGGQDARIESRRATDGDPVEVPPRWHRRGPGGLASPS